MIICVPFSLTTQIFLCLARKTLKLSQNLYPIILTQTTHADTYCNAAMQTLASLLICISKSPDQPSQCSYPAFLLASSSPYNNNPCNVSDLTSL